MCQGKEQKHSDLTDRDYKWSTIIFAVLVLTAIVLKAQILPRWPVHQDEFNYLSAVHAYERGELTKPFQNFHVHFFGWLSTVGDNEVTQVIAARFVMYLFLLGTCFYLFRTACYFLVIRGALFCVLCYLSFIFTIANGASFRHDTPATFFFMFALYHFVVREDSLSSNLLAGLAMAVSLLFTIKAAIYLPVFAGWFLSRLMISNERAKSLRHMSYFLTALILGFMAIYKLHGSTLPHSAVNSNTGFLSSVFSTFVTLEQIFPARTWIIQTFIIDSIIWSLLLGGFICYLIDLLRHRYTRIDTAAYLFVFFIPLLSLLVYINAYPYFFVFLVPTATLFCGYAFERLASKLKNAKRVTIPFLSVILGILVLANFIVHFPRYMRSTELTALQRNLMSTIHTMFPEPVPYVDKCSMVSSYPKIGIFMSVAGMRHYLQCGEPIMDELLANKKPLFLLANHFFLDLNSKEPPRSTHGQVLLEADWKVLRSYFIHHWGPVWVVGKQFSLGPEIPLQHFEIIVPGLYTVETDTDTLIDGTLCRHGNVVSLGEGVHTIEVKGMKATIKLKWGDHLYRPDNELEWTTLLGPFY